MRHTVRHLTPLEPTRVVRVGVETKTLSVLAYVPVVSSSAPKTRKTGE